MSCAVLALLLTTLLPVAQDRKQEPGTIKLSVLDCNGGPIGRCKVTLLRAMPQHPDTFGRVPQFADRELQQSDFDGSCATLRDLPAGEFVLQIAAEMHAMGRSAPFRVGGNDVSEVRVKLTRGATCCGTVRGADGKPLAGVAVRSDSQMRMQVGDQFLKLFGQFLASTVTQTATTTDAKGHFELPHLAAGKYCIVVEHADYCVREIEADVATDAKVTIDDIALQRGCAVSGTVLLGAAAEEGLRVQVTWVATATASPKSLSALTDAKGRWLLPQRLPPGQYQISACRPTKNNNPLEMLKQMQATQRQLEITAEQDKLTADFVIPK